MADLKRIGDIDVVAEIGRSTTTIVYKGYRAAAEQWVLVKMLYDEAGSDSDLVECLEREARLLAKIKHPNIVDLFDYTAQDDGSYITSEFIDGPDLSELLKSRKFPPALAWFVLQQTALGLQAAHQKNILHGDIKPSNILVSFAGEVKLADFGMAALKSNPHAETQQEIKGTLAYFSPEQILGEKQGEFSDIFSLGATFYELLTGTTAFHGENSREYFKAIIEDDPIAYLSKDEDIPAELIGICAKMLAKRVGDRYATCKELLAALDGFSAGHDFEADAVRLSSYLQKPHDYTEAIVVRPVSGPVHRSGWRASRLIYLAILVLFIVAAYFAASELAGVNTADLDPVATISASPDPGEQSPAAQQGSSVQTASTPAPENLLGGTGPLAEPTPKAVQPDAIVRRDTSLQSESEVGESVAVPPGLLLVTCTPWAQVFVDGDSLGLTPLGGPIALPAGMHEVVFKNPGFQQRTESIEVKSNEETVLDFSFWSTVGRLKLDVSPWAEVFIDDVFKDSVPPQDTPFVLTPGLHRLSLRHPEIGQWDTEVNIVAGQSLQLQFNLKSLLSR